MSPCHGAKKAFYPVVSRAEPMISLVKLSHSAYAIIFSPILYMFFKLSINISN